MDLSPTAVSHCRTLSHTACYGWNEHVCPSRCGLDKCNKFEKTIVIDLMIIVYCQIVRLKGFFVCLFGVLHTIREYFIWRRHPWIVFNFYPYSAFMAIKQRGFFSILWHGASIYDGLISKDLCLSQLLPGSGAVTTCTCFYDLRLSPTRNQTLIFGLWGKHSNRLSHRRDESMV